MTRQVVPLQNVPAQRLSIRLGNQTTRLTVIWSASSEAWHITMEYPVGTPLVSGRRLALDEPVLGDVPTGFSGDIWCRSDGESEIEPGLEAWAGTHHLVYES